MTTATNARIPPGPAEPYSPKEDLLRWMQRNFERYGDIYRASVYGSDVYVVNSPDYAEHVLLRRWQNFLRKGQAVKRIALSLGNGLISSNGPLWVKQRRMIQPAFTRESVAALRTAIVTPNVALRDRWQAAARSNSSVNVTQDVSSTVLEVTLLAIFGADYGRVAADFHIIADESRNLEFAQTCNALAKVIIQIAEDRRRQDRDASDILGTMMRSRDRDGGRPMPDTQLAREALTLVIAGHETTASVLNWIWYLLSRHPRVEQKMVAEIRELLPDAAPPSFDSLGRFTYTRQVIEEALRTYPPLWLMTRNAKAADQLGEYLVPAGTEIYISPYLLQRHPRLWPDADQFAPERFDSGRPGAEEQRPRLSMCPFGAGPRNCIGEFFARVEIQLHLLLIARGLHLRYDDPRAAETVAAVNLLSRWHFIMQPQLRRW
ncbi:MAG: cytochrome P450 [Gammaproteobacteria bacterium]|nr:cytochrome P450 [Gammaproteobacteria bacterium]